jgi:hypothetical protein
MDRREFRLSEGTANKLWIIELQGTGHTVHFGRIGTAGQVQTKDFDSEPAAQKLTAAGFVAVQFVKFSEKAWFNIDGVEVREIKLIAHKRAKAVGPTRQVVYRGPFAADDAGNQFPRGARTAVDAAAAAALERSAAAEQFLFLQPAGALGGCWSQ